MIQDELRVVLVQELPQILIETLATLKVEVVSVCSGHMDTTTYWLAVRHGERTLLKVRIGDDGFNDGDQLGWSYSASRSVKRAEEV